MVTTTQMYWLTKLDALEGFSVVMTMLGLLVTAVATMLYAAFSWNTMEYERRMMRNILRVSVPVLAIGIAVDVFVPSTKEMAAILVVPRIVNSESLTGMANGIKTLATEWLEELRPGKDGE